MTEKALYSADLERAVLCALIIDPKKLNDVLEHISDPVVFYVSKNQLVYKAMLNLYEKHQYFDLVMLADEVKDPVYVAELTNMAITSAHAVDHAAKLYDLYVRRELRKACEKSIELISNNDESLADTVASVDALVMTAAKKIKNTEIADMETLAAERFRKYVSDAAKGKVFEGFRTGFVDLDYLVEGFGLGENIILAARPSMGKTALALNIARNVAGSGIPVIIFSLEMRKERVADRLLCAEAGIDSRDYRNRILTDESLKRLEAALNKLIDLPIKIVDGTITTADIKSVIAREANKKWPLLVVIDFLTLIADKRTANMSAHEHFGGIAKKIQFMAREFNIPIMLLAQLNREVEKRSEKKPFLSDLRESGNIEEAADKDLFIYRDDYYNEDSKDKGIAEIICAKNRDGEIGTVKLAWQPKYVKFLNLAYQ